LLSGFGEDDEEEDPGPMADPDGRVGMPDNIKKRIQQELDRQGAFQKKLRYLRQELENAHFAKPVCARYLHCGCVKARFGNVSVPMPLPMRAPASAPL